MTHHDDSIYDAPEKLRTSTSGFVEHKIIKKPWGSEELLVYTEHYTLKFLNVNAGELLSLQYHEQKIETLHVMDGTGILTIGTDENELQTIPFNTGATLHLMPRTIHTFEAITPLKILEVSTPQIWDVVRLKDKYGRKKPPVGA